MKKILVTVSLVGAAAAGIILYFRNRNEDAVPKRIQNAASDAYKAMNDGIGKVERAGQHAMG